MSEQPGTTPARVAVFRGAGRTSRVLTADTVASLRAIGASPVVCADSGTVLDLEGLDALDYDVVLQIGAGAGAARLLAERLGIPLVESGLAPGPEAARRVRLAREGRSE